MNKMDKIIVAGSGTAGFVTALILKTRFPRSEISIVRSKKIGIIGVGEGSTEHWNEFMQYIGVPFTSVIKYCDATFKCGIMFKNWSDLDYMHSIGPENEIKNGQYPMIYGKHIAEGVSNKYMNPSLSWESKVYSLHLDPKEAPPYNQYHFNTHKLNDFLTKICELKNIDIFDDEIVDVILNEQGEIKCLKSIDKEYHADFFIDSTGFNRLLISKLGGKWQSYNKYLKMKSAIVFPQPSTDILNMYTTATAMDYGWMFNIPVWDRSGNGYIFDSDHITADQAQQEVENLLGKKIEIGKQINFDPGALDKVWIKNCCAVGLAASFVEPLEASSIGTSIQQAFLLMHRLPNYDEKTIEKYNRAVENILTNIRDFVFLHYITKKDHNQFWKEVKNIRWPEFLEENIPRWRHNLPIADDFSLDTDYVLFRDSHYLQILHGLRFFNRESIREEYSVQHEANKKRAEDFIRTTRTQEKIEQSVDHREFIGRIRNL
jgi:tryptophan halogenase